MMKLLMLSSSLPKGMKLPKRGTKKKLREDKFKIKRENKKRKQPIKRLQPGTLQRTT